MSRKIGLDDTHFDHDIDGDIDFDFFGDDEANVSGEPTAVDASNALKIIDDSTESRHQLTEKFGEISNLCINHERNNSNKPNDITFQQCCKPSTAERPDGADSPIRPRSPSNHLFLGDHRMELIGGRLNYDWDRADKKIETSYRTPISVDNNKKLSTLQQPEEFGEGIVGGANDLAGAVTMTDAFSSIGHDVPDGDGGSVVPEKFVPPGTMIDKAASGGAIPEVNCDEKTRTKRQEGGTNGLAFPSTSFTDQSASDALQRSAALLRCQEGVDPTSHSLQSPLFVDVDNDSSSDLYSLTDSDDDDDDSLSDEFYRRRPTHSGSDCQLRDDDNFDSDITDVSPLSSANMSPLPPKDPSPSPHRRHRSSSLPPGTDPAMSSGSPVKRSVTRPKSSSVGASATFTGNSCRTDSDDSVSHDSSNFRTLRQVVPLTSATSLSRVYRGGHTCSSNDSDTVDLKVLSKAISELEVERRIEEGSSLSRGSGTDSSAGLSSFTGRRLDNGSSVGSGSACGSGKSCARPRRNMTFSNDEARRIEQDNRRLLRKIIDCNRPRKTNVPATAHLASSAINRLKDMRKIESDNLTLLKRLHAAKPTKELSRDYLMSGPTRRGPHTTTVPTSKSSGSLTSTRTVSPFVTSAGRGRGPHHARSTGCLNGTSTDTAGSFSGNSSARSGMSRASGGTSNAAISVDGREEETKALPRRGEIV